MIDAQYVAHQPVEHVHRQYGLQEADEVVRFIISVTMS